MKPLAAFGLGLFALACAGGETATLSLRAGLSGDLAEGSAPVPGAPSTSAAKRGVSGKDEAGTVFTVTAASMAIRDIEFDLPDDDGCDDFGDGDLSDDVFCSGEKVSIAGPLVADLVLETTTPSLDGLTVPAGPYRRLDVRLEPIKKGSDLVDENSQLRTASLVASGGFELDGPKTFDLALKFDLDARFEDEDGVEVTADTETELFLRLNVAQWFSDLPITNCIEDGKLEIVDNHVTLDDKNDCHDIERTLRDAIRNSGRLHGH